ncbi:MAG: methylated-DNA--[protein]-cysteine S-methyltransferase [Burkholderiales bacterium]|nr:methylated-DNA--[protein]-cysteine S-methyltransferase [Burkholderiales bacterium]
MLEYLHYQSPLGPLLLAASERGLAGVYFAEHRHFKGMAGWRRNDEHAVLQQTAAQLGSYFSGQRQEFDLPLDLSQGTQFQQAVWQALRKLTYGSTASYADIAAQIGKPAAVRAVGAANGRNPISIIVPCHRVIASSGALTGYAGGLPNKVALLSLEKSINT